MKGSRVTILFLAVILCAPLSIFLVMPVMAQDVEGSRDHPLFTRLPNYYIDNYQESEFDAYDGFVTSDGSYKTVEGRKFHINYHFKEGTRYLSDAQIKGNYREAFKKIGGEVQYGDSYNVHMSPEKGGKTTWVRVHPWNGGQ